MHRFRTSSTICPRFRFRFGKFFREKARTKPVGVCTNMAARLILCLLIVLVHLAGGEDDEALRHLLSGNELAGQGRHLEAIEAWRFSLLLAKRERLCTHACRDSAHGDIAARRFIVHDCAALTHPVKTPVSCARAPSLERLRGCGQTPTCP